MNEGTKGRSRLVSVVLGASSATLVGGGLILLVVGSVIRGDEMSASARMFITAGIVIATGVSVARAEEPSSDDGT